MAPGAGVNTERIEAIARRFGGSRLALLAAQQALQRVQDQAEQDTAESSEASLLQHLPSAPLQPSAQLENAAAPNNVTAEDGDEALLLSDLLNSRATTADAGVQQKWQPACLGRLQQPPPTATDAVPSEAAVAVLPEAGGGPEFSTKLSEEPCGSPCDDGSSSSSSSMGSPAQRRLQDAAEDTVLCGSPMIGHDEWGSSSSSIEDSSSGTSPVASAGHGPGGPADQVAVAERGEQLQGAEGLRGNASASCKPQQALKQPTTVGSHMAAPVAGCSCSLATLPPSRSTSKQQQQQPAARDAGSDGRPPKEAVKQQTWSFAAIPPGFASIPSKGGATRLPHQDPAGGRPAFYTRTNSPAGAVLRPATANPGPAKASAARKAAPAGSTATQRRWERLELLSQPRHSRAPTGKQQRPAAAVQGAEGAPIGHALPAGGEHAGQGSGSGLPKQVEPRSNQPVAGSSGIPACRPAAMEAGWSGTFQSCHPKQQQQQQQHLNSSRSSGAKAWPQQLGQQLTGTELQRATGTYSQDRFEQHLQKISAALAAWRERRGQAADATAAGVDAFVARVHQLSTDSCVASSSSTAAALPGAGSGQQAAVSATAALRSCPAGAKEHAERCSSLANPAAQQLSLTERLHNCQQKLRQRPLTAPATGGANNSGFWAGGCDQTQQLRPGSCSPGKVKSLVQVKGEQERALQQLHHQLQHFPASPLPLSTMQPRYQQLVAAQEHRRQGPREQLLEQQRPFSFKEREAERQQWRRVRNWSPDAEEAAMCGSDHPKMPSMHQAQLVPISTTEARYALLVAELQLQGRTVRGRLLASPSCLPRAPHAQHAYTLTAGPGRRPATAEHGIAVFPAVADVAGGVVPTRTDSDNQMLSGGTDERVASLCEPLPSIPAFLGAPSIAAEQPDNDSQQQLPGLLPMQQQSPGAETLPAAEQSTLPAAAEEAEAASVSCYSSFESCSVRSSGEEVADAAADGTVMRQAGQPAAPVFVAVDEEDEAAANADQESQYGSVQHAQPSYDAGSPMPAGRTHASLLQPSPVMAAADPVCQGSPSGGAAAVDGGAASSSTQAACAEQALTGSMAGTSPVVQRLGLRVEAPAGHPVLPCREALGFRQSSNGNRMPLVKQAAVCAQPSPLCGEAGIAVPLNLLSSAAVSLSPAGAAGGAGAGQVVVYAELVAGDSLPGEATASSASSAGAGDALDLWRDSIAIGGAPAVVRRQRQRFRGDTPPQHIAARHRQAETAARSVVRRVLLQSGSSAAMLSQGG